LGSIKLSTDTLSDVEASYGTYVRREAHLSEKMIIGLERPAQGSRLDREISRTARVEGKRRTVYLDPTDQATERRVIDYLLDASNGNLIVWMKPDGSLWKRSVLRTILGEGGREAFVRGGVRITLAAEEQSAFTKMVTKGRSSEFLKLFGDGQQMLKVKIDPILNSRGLVSFCGIHDLIVGSLWDGFRMEYMMPRKGDGISSAKWTMSKSLTTLPLQNWWKLGHGWDTTLAVVPPRLVGRDMIDLIMTRMFPLWEGKGHFVYGYRDKVTDTNTPEEFLDAHVGPRPWNAGGLARYTPAAFLIKDLGFNRYEPSEKQHQKLAEYYLNWPMENNGTKKQLESRYQLTKDELTAVDGKLSRLLGILKKGNIKRDTGYNEKEMTQMALSLACTAALVNDENPDAFQGVNLKHPDVMGQCRVWIESRRKLLFAMNAKKLSAATGQDLIDLERQLKVKALADTVKSIGEDETSILFPRN
jgi:hypothetical protein